MLYFAVPDTACVGRGMYFLDHEVHLFPFEIQLFRIPGRFNGKEDFGVCFEHERVAHMLIMAWAALCALASPCLAARGDGCRVSGPWVSAWQDELCGGYCIE